MKYVLDHLAVFRYQTHTTSCTECKKSYEAVVRYAVSRTRGYFDGLCLDCIDKSNPKTDSSNIDY